MSNALDNVFALASRIDVTEPRWGAKGDGTADDYAAIQACINANPGKTIYFPNGFYRITQKLHITTTGTRLQGEGPNAYILATGANIDAVHFENLSLDGSYRAAMGLSNLYIFRTSAATAGAGLRVTRCSNFEGSDFFVLNMPEGVRVEGGQFNNLTRFRILSNGATFNLSGTANSCALRFSQAPLTVGFQPCYTANVSHFFIACSGRWQRSIVVANGDGLQFSSGYTNQATVSELCVTQDRDASYVAPTQFTNIYFDGVFLTQHAVDIPADGFTSFVSSLVFVNCFFGQTASTIMRIRKAAQIELTSCHLGNAPGWGIDSEAAGVKLSIHGGRLFNLGSDDGTTGGLRFAGGALLSVNGAEFESDGGTVGSLRLEGTIETVTLIGNTIKSTAADISNAATIADFVCSGNNSDRTASATSLLGVRVNNTAVNDPAVLDWYQESTFTPEVRFGGATTGITYTSREGNFTRIGDRVFFDLDLLLSSKGSATGAITIEGLPFAAGKHSAVNVWMNAVTSGVGDSSLMAFIPLGASGLRIDTMVAGTATQLTDANVTGSLRVRAAGSYRV